MKKIKEVEANGLYVFQGRSSAKSEIVRNLESAREFITSANERFAGYMKIRDYSIAQDTWTILVEIEDAESVVSTYLSSRARSKKAKSENTLTQIWKIISDCVRHWLSRFVKLTNAQDGREGSLRLRTYERFLFESLEEAKKYVDEMKDQLVSVPQKRRRFRVKKKNWTLRKVGFGHVYLCSRGLKRVGSHRVFGSAMIDIIESGSDVLRHLVELTMKLHFLPNYPFPSLE